ncbi:MAG: sugar ABC transporter ATP-binding protein [Christensenellaceae bacterium]|jgi:D-xylose transport system ATP-binding protein
MAEGYLLEVKNLTKIFPGVKALDNVNIAITEGTVHAICGENGAGKSTLINTLCGVYPYPTYEGDIILDGELQHFYTLREAEDKGIACVHQELALVPELNVAENIFLGRQPLKAKTTLDMEKMGALSRDLIKSIGITTDPATGIDPFTPVKHLSVQKQQIVEILKALSKNTRILILDEPTASLTEHEVDSLLEMVDLLRKNGVTCIYISHKLDEVVRIADEVTILRDGKSIETRPIASFPKEEIISSMVGRTLEQLFPREEHTSGEARLEVKHYSVEHPDIPGKMLLNDINLVAKKGEILGVSGLMGSGRTELFSSIFGTLKAKATGEVYIDGQKKNMKTPRQALDSGIVIVTEDRKKYGLVLDMNIMENTTLANLAAVSKNGVLNVNEELKQTNKAIEYFRIKTPSVEEKAQNLSGGNQQKVVLGKAMLGEPKILILDEPTRGIDVGAKYEIYKIMNQLVNAGVAIIMISSDMEEILGMSDRIIIFNEGEVKGEMDYKEATQNKILSIAQGG